MLKIFMPVAIAGVLGIGLLGLRFGWIDQRPFQVSAGMHPQPNLEPTPLGIYRGAFRIKLGANHPKLMNRDGLLASHPESGKLYWAVSGPSMPAIGTSSAGAKSYVGSFDLPDFSHLDPNHSLDETPTANAVIGWVELSEDYLEHAKSNTKPNYVRIGGMAFDRDNQKLYINWARYYHVQSDAVPSLAEYDPVTLKRVSDFHTPSGTAGEASDPNGRITSLAQTPLRMEGDFLCTPYWGSKMYGPRQNLIRMTGANSVKLSALMTFNAKLKWDEASFKIQCGSGVFTSSEFVFPMRNGTAGWYGYNDGYKDLEQKQFVAGGDSLVPDLWGTNDNKSYHAPPYKAYLASISVTELKELAAGKRAPQEANLELHDFTEQQFQYRTDDQGQKQYQSLVARSIVEQDDHYFVLGEREDTTSSIYNPGPVIYVYSRSPQTRDSAH